MIDKIKSSEALEGNYVTYQFPRPIAYLIHEATNTNINVYKPINIFQRYMLRVCFGLKYVKSNITSHY